jgi:hypothetical protein
MHIEVESANVSPVLTHFVTAERRRWSLLPVKRCPEGGTRCPDVALRIWRIRPVANCPAGGPCVEGA